MSALPTKSLPLRIRGKQQYDLNFLYIYLPAIVLFLLAEYAIYLDRNPPYGVFFGMALLLLLLVVGLALVRSVLYRGVSVDLEWTADHRAFAIIHPGGNYGALDSQLSWSAKYRGHGWFRSTEKAVKDYLGVGHFDPVLAEVLLQTDTEEFRVPLVRYADSSPQMTRPETSYWTVTLDHTRTRGLIGRTWAMKLPHIPAPHMDT